MADINSKIQVVYQRIQKERKMVEGFRAMAAATSNYDVRASCEAKVRDSEKTIQWFEQSLRELQKKQGGNASGSNGGAGSDVSSIASSSGSSPYGRGGPPGSASSQSTLGASSSASPSTYSRTNSGASTATANTSAPSSHRNRVLPPTPGSSSEEPFDPRRGAAQGPPPHQSASGFNTDNGVSTLSIRRRPAFTNLDLIKYDTPLNSAKISKMLNQLEFKLRVEKEYMQGIEKMAKLYQVEGDKKARHDAEAKRIESKGKKDLLEAALKRYKTLDIMGGVFDEDEGEEVDDDAKGLNRRPVSGTLEITIKSARDLDHLPTNRRKPTETVVVVKVEDTPRARTHPSRTDRWNEDFELHVDKANEVEVTIYDKPPGTNETPTPIGMLWVRLSDVVDELRRKKVGAEAGAGWVTAAGVEGGGSTPPPPQIMGMGHQHSSSLGGGGNGAGLDAPVANAQSAAMRPGTAVDGIDAWFSVEPAGQIELHLNFIKSNVRKRPYDAGGLGRQGAVRKRKEDVLEQNGHKFIQKQFYGVVLCAFCNEFLLKAAGMQCEDCRYTCHKKCYDKVVTKCVSKSNAEADKDGDKINHRIPHRFEPITTLSPSWCCHCGQIVPLSRKKARKCSECGLSCHADCAHLVPDFCGMSMEMARQIIGHTRTINQTRSSAHTQQGGSISNISAIPGVAARPTGYSQQPPQQQYQQQQIPASPSAGRIPLVGQQDIVDGTNRMQIEPAKRPLPPSMPTQQQQQQQPSPQGRIAPPSGQQMPYPQQQQQQQAPPPPASQQQRPPSSGPQPGRNQYPLPAGASMQQRQSFTPLPPGAAQGPPGTTPGAFADQQTAVGSQQQQQEVQRPMSQVQQPSQQRPGPGQRPVSDYQQQQAMQGPRPMNVASQQQQQQQRPMQPPAPQPQQPQHMQIDPRIPPSNATVPQKAAGPPQQQQRQSFIQQQQQYPLPGQQQQQQQLPVVPGGPATPTKARPPQMAATPSQQQVTRAPRKVGLDDFNFLAVLGKGNFGKVMLAEEKRTGKQWAIKVLKKEFIIENDEIESTKSEKRVFLAAARERHPFLLDLHSCFQTETRIYFVMEYVQGGDLMLHIQREQFTQRRARFYAAEVLLALEYFHKEGIVYRDLKLDNILLTLDGHVKVADYGLCKENMWYGKTTSTFCGTPEFMAPEILLEQRYGRAVDWWAFGVLIYEMLLGQSPFRGDDEDEIFDAILEDEPLYPIHMPHASVSILQQLLCRDPTRRLGSGPDDAEAIKRHPFFKDINWDDIMNKRIPSPYFPQVSGPLDTSNFDQEFTREQPTLTPVHSQLSAQDQKEFKDFSWIGPAGMEDYM